MYHKVTEWDDSAGKEAFINAKRRYWAKKNGLSCNTPPPDPDLYIDQINWDSDTNLDYDYILYSDVGTLPKIEENHESVVIFGDCFKPNQDLVTVGWGDIDEGKFASPPTYPLPNYVNPWANNEWAPAAWQPVYSNDAWQGYTNDAWQGYNNGTGHAYMPWEGDWSHWNTWDYATYCWYNYSGQEIRGTWNENNAAMNMPGGYMSSYEYSKFLGNEQRREHDKGLHERSNTRGWNSSSIAVGRSWDWE